MAGWRSASSGSYSGSATDEAASGWVWGKDEGSDGWTTGSPSSDRIARGRKEARLLARLTGAAVDETEVEVKEEAVAGMGLLLAVPLVGGMLLLLGVACRYLQSLPKKQRPCDTQ